MLILGAHRFDQSDTRDGVGPDNPYAAIEPSGASTKRSVDRS